MWILADNWPQSLSTLTRKRCHLCLLPTKLLRSTQQQPLPSSLNTHQARQVLNNMVRQLRTRCGRHGAQLHGCTIDVHVLDAQHILPVGLPLHAEEAFDGERVQVHYRRAHNARNKDEVWLFGETGNDYTEHYRDILDETLKILRKHSTHMKDAIIDGYIVVHDPLLQNNAPWMCTHKLVSPGTAAPQGVYMHHDYDMPDLGANGESTGSWNHTPRFSPHASSHHACVQVGLACPRFFSSVCAKPLPNDTRAACSLTTRGCASSRSTSCI